MARKKTNEEFIKEICDLVGDEYIFLESYVNNATKIKCKHNICNHKWTVSPNQFLSGSRCPKCAKNGLKTNERFVKEVCDLVGSEYVFLEDYINAITKIKCRHNKCGFEWEIKPSDFLSGRGCLQCNRPNYNRDTGQFVEEVYNLVGDEYDVVGEYINTDTKIQFKHNECNHEFEMTPNHFLTGNRCPTCAIKKIALSLALSYEDVKNYIEIESGSGCKLISDEYINSKTKLKIQCECGNVFEKIFQNFKKQPNCPECGTKRGSELLILTYEEVKHFIEVESDSGCKLLSEKYKGGNERLKLQCKCGDIFYTKYNKFKHNNKQQCNKCGYENKINSYGEERVKKWLDENCLYYIPQNTFEDCRNKNPLSFDFYIPNHNVLIEYDGKQHFKPIKFFGGQRQLEYIRHNDNIKNQYCKDNNILLIRIPYWQFNKIEEILDKRLNNYNIIFNNNYK